MKARELIQSAVEVVRPPSPAELRQRLNQARQSVVQAEQAVQASQAAVDVSYGLDDNQATPSAVLKAESDRAQARLVLERAAGRAAALERQVQAAEASQAAQELEAGRRQLAHLIEKRSELGVQILNALDRLEGAVKAFGVNEDAIISLPLAVRGRSAVPGHNLGAGALQAHLASELAQRGVLGQRSSIAGPSLADWLALGNRTLGS